MSDKKDLELDRELFHFLIDVDSSEPVTVFDVKTLSLLYHFYTFLGKYPKGVDELKTMRIFIDPIKNPIASRAVTDADIAAAVKIPPPAGLTDNMIIAVIMAKREAAGLGDIPITLRNKKTGKDFTF